MKKLPYLLLFCNFLLFMGISNQSLFAQDISTGLVGHWRFDGDLNDATSRSNHATSSTSPFFVNGANGEVNSALALNGNDQFLTIENLDDYAFGTSDFTFATWVNYTSSGYSMCLLDKSSSNLGLCLFLDKNGDGLVTARTRSGNEVSSMGTKINDGAWHLVVFSRETGDANGTPISILSVYIDGELNNVTELSSVDDISNSLPLLVSQRSLNNTDRRYKGKLDDYRSYNRALGDDDIQALYESQGRPSSSTYTYYRDKDKDGFGNPDASIKTKNNRPPNGYVSNKKDCNDNEDDINPDAPEICGNDIDENCDGIVAPSVSGITGTSTVVQPTCTDAKGSITTTFNGLPANKYKVILQDAISGCMYYMKMLTLNAASLDDPIVNVTQPTCNVSAGTITFTFPTSGATYSYDGGVTFVTNSSKSGLAPGRYRVCYRDNASGCISKEIEVTVNAVPNTINAPTVKVNQPTCDLSLGTITVTSPLSGVTYSFDNGSSFQSSNTKSGLGAGTYQVRVKDNSSGCVSNATGATINSAISPLFAPTVVVTQPTCGNPYGTLTVTSILTNVSYSFDGGATFIPENFKSGLAPGTYYICIRDNATGCISREAQAIINAAPYGPNAPTLSITQPTCSNSLGSITVANPAYGTGYVYSFDNGNSFQSSNVKNGLPAGTYYVRVRNNSGCVSAATTAVLNPAVGGGYSPVCSVTHPTCYYSKGTISVTTPSTGVTYSFDGGVSFITQSYKADLDPGAYRICVRDMYSGCISKEVPVDVNPIPYTPAAPTVSVTQPTCNTTLGSITVTSPLSGVTYSFDNGASFQYSNVKTGLAAGTYYVRVRYNNTNCVSAYVAVTIYTGGSSYTPTCNVSHPTCNTPKGTISFSYPLGANMTYSYDGGVNFVNESSRSDFEPGSYRVCSRDRNTGCISQEVGVVVNPAPYGINAPTVSIIHPSCLDPWGSITVTSPSYGTGYTYSFDNGASFQSSNVKGSLGAGTYYVRVKNSSGCVSSATTAVLTTTGGSYTPSVSVTQPTCAVSTGTITFTSPLGSNYTYSYDGGITFVAQSSRSGLAPGTYRVCAREIYSGCISNELTVVINSAPYGLNPPTVSITQPNCSNSWGSITVINPAYGTGYTYSFDNGNYFQSSNVISNLYAGTYYVRVKNSSGCISSATAVVITSSSGGSYTPTVSVTQPTCAMSTGTITFTSPLGSNYTYSYNGGVTFIPQSSLSGLVPGNYRVCAREIYTGCISNEVGVVIYAAPYGLDDPIVSVTQPTCSNSYGSITVISPAYGTGYTYSFNNGSTYQSSNVLNNLGAGNYYVRVKNSYGCTSSATIAVVNSAVGGSYTPTVSVTQPTCALSTGTITFTSPLGGNYTYSYDGGATFVPQSSRSGLVPGNYRVCVREIYSGCISTEVQVIINAAPYGLNPPTVSVIQPSCGSSLGSITVVNPAYGTGYTYSFNNGSSYQSSNVSNLGAGTYYVKVKNSAGCESSATLITLNPASGGGSYTINATTAACSGDPVTLTVSPVCSTCSFQWSPGGVTVASITVSPSVTTTYTVSVTNNGCVSTATKTITVSSGGTAPIPNIAILQPNCTSFGKITILNLPPGASTRIISSTFAVENGNDWALDKSIYGNLVAGLYDVKVKVGCGESSVKVALYPEVFRYTAGKCYKIVNFNSNKSLNVYDMSMSDGAAINQTTYTSMTNQNWYFGDVTGYFKIAVRHSGKAVTSSGSNVIQSTYLGNGSSEWFIECIGGGRYRIQNRSTGKYLSIAGSSTYDGANAITTMDNGADPSVHWYIVEVPCMVGSDLIGKNPTSIEAQQAADAGTKNGSPIKDEANISTEMPNQKFAKIQNVRIFPNPANNFIEVQLEKMPADGFKVTLLNTLGSRVSEMIAKEGQTVRLNTQQLPNGLYIIQISEKGKPDIRKEIVIQK